MCKWSVMLVMVLALALALAAAPTRASDLSDLFGDVSLTLGVVVDREKGENGLGVSAGFKADPNGNAADWLKNAGLTAFSDAQEANGFFAKAGLYLLAVPTYVAGHVVGHAEITGTVAKTNDGTLASVSEGFGFSFGPEENPAKLSVGWHGFAGKPVYFFGWQKAVSL